MQAIILAAGVGSRLRPLTDSSPKCLVPVGSGSILSAQLRALRRGGIDAVRIVVGHLAAMVKNHPDVQAGDVRVIENEVYASTNNMFSLSLALKDLNGPAIVMNGDVICDEAIIRTLVSAPHPEAIAVDTSQYFEESMKIVTNRDGRIVKISKAIPKPEAAACSIDIYRFSDEGIRKLREKIDSYLDRGERNLWTEVAIDALFPDLAVYPVDIAGMAWVEVDNHDDLALARKLFVV